MVMFADRPVTGFGPGSYELVFPEYRQRVFSNRMLTVHPHNEYVELLGEYGLIGAALVIWVLVSFCTPMMRLVLRSEHKAHWFPAVAILSALAGTAVHGFFDFELRIFPNALMLSLLAGCAAAPILQMKDQPSASSRWISRVFALIIIVLTLLALQTMPSAHLRVMADKARLVEGDRARAEKLYKASAWIDPQNWRAHLGLGQIYSHYRYYELAPEAKREWGVKEEAKFAKAYRHNTKKEEVVYGLGRAELALGNRERGLELLRQAADYKRFNDFYWRKLGIELRKAGLYEEALERFEYARKLDRSNKTTKRNIQWLEGRLKQARD
jgi:tetratricopeptide (TPR) repeat protein